MIKFNGNPTGETLPAFGAMHDPLPASPFAGGGTATLLRGRGLGWGQSPTASSPARSLSIWLKIISLIVLSALSARANAAASELAFDRLYSSYGVLGLEFSDQVKALAGKRVAMRGFMAPPLKAESQFFVLTKMPMALCPFCSSDADWPEDIVVIYLARRQTFVQNNAMIAVEGVLEYGSWTDPETGFVSLLRLRDATFDTL
ncbi:hypothetical protein SGP15_19610 [Brenneria sp. L4-2C]|uniref:hypothetical protein n=1 Tax=Brenneria sp. L4-2C TaxID=3094863 RepID=UPI0029C32B42|nr:hypothetical protein [Brenneria sp. L4-2C]MDX5630095.1 hypothetical protein [Brenneria sp. L3-3Z]MDX5697296.1 hypothetical protein [Brenneria sp. L4-2C]